MSNELSAFGEQLKNPAAWKDFDIARNKQISHHEAAHAVAQFLFGEDFTIEFISMEGDDEFGARVRSSKRRETLRILEVFERNDFYDRSERDHFLGLAYCEILHSFAGPSAENRVTDADDLPYEGWVVGLCELGYEADLSELVYGTDIYRALEMAIAVCGSLGRAWRMLKRSAVWADELMTEPRVWQTVTSLASKLPAGVMMSGDEARAIMREGWGGNGIPFFDLPYKWRRRFRVFKPNNLGRGVF